MLRYFPVPLVEKYLTDPEDFLDILIVEELYTEFIIWNAELRNHLSNQLKSNWKSQRQDIVNQFKEKKDLKLKNYD